MINVRRRAFAALTAAGLLWGTTVPLSKLALAWLAPAWLAFARLGLAAAVLLVVAGRPGLRAALRPAVLSWGALGYGGALALQNAGITRTSVTHAALLIGATPVLIAVIAAIWRRTVARPLSWAGFAVSLGGVALVAGGHGGGATLAGDGMVLASLVASATFTVAQVRLLDGRDPVAVTAVQFLAAAAAVLPLAITTAGPASGPASPGAVTSSIALALAGTVAPFTLFAYGQSRVAAPVAGAFLNIEPLVGAVAGAMLFGDPAGWPLLAGGTAILAGIGLSSLPGLGRQPQDRGEREQLASGRRGVLAGHRGRLLAAAPEPAHPGRSDLRGRPVRPPALDALPAGVGHGRPHGPVSDDPVPLAPDRVHRGQPGGPAGRPATGPAHSPSGRHLHRRTAGLPARPRGHAVPRVAGVPPRRTRHRCGRHPCTDPDTRRPARGRCSQETATPTAQRPRPGDVVGYATRIALRELGRRTQFLDQQLERLDELIVPLVAARAPGLLALYGVGPYTAAMLLAAAGDHPERLRSEAAWAHLCAAAPIPASSGKVTRHRLNPGGNRQANHALYPIVITRMSSHPPARAYAARRTKEGLGALGFAAFFLPYQVFVFVIVISVVLYSTGEAFSLLR